MKTIKDYQKRIRTIREQVKRLESEALRAVYYVGAANYREREYEALQWVRAAAEAALSK